MNFEGVSVLDCLKEVIGGGCLTANVTIDLTIVSQFVTSYNIITR